MTLSLDHGPRYPGLRPAHVLARPLGYVISPLLVTQGRMVRKNRPRLPNAPMPWSGTISGPKPLRLLGLGDSTIAGVGVDNPMLGLTAQLARALYKELGRGISWDGVGERGITTGQLLERYLPIALQETEHVDIAMVSIGANDAKNLQPRRPAIRNLSAIVKQIHERFPHALIMVSSLPAFGKFESLPAPLRSVMAHHAKGIEVGMRRFVEAQPYALMSPPPSHYPPTFFAEDGFHPGAEGYRVWASFAVADAVGRGALDHLRSR
ncbi:MAG: SGNH/GDSL hydrolase family protein [Pontimonas sp.]